MEVKAYFDMMYTNYDIFDPNSHHSKFEYINEKTCYADLSFTYITTVSIFDHFKKTIGIDENKFIQHDDASLMTDNELDSSNILQYKSPTDIRFVTTNETYLSLNNVIKETIKEDELVFLSKELFMFMKEQEGFNNVNPIKKVLYKENDRLKVELHHPQLEVVLLNNNDFKRRKIRLDNLDQFIVKCYVSKFMNKNDLLTILKELAQDKGFFDLDTTKIYLPIINELTKKDKRLLLRGNLKVIEIEDENLSCFDIFQNRKVIFQFKAETDKFVINFKPEPKEFVTYQHKTEYQVAEPNQLVGFGVESDKIGLLDGENDGKIGLNNIGNTCYMNSVLQCLLHNGLLKSFIMSKTISNEINLSNPLGSKGQLLLAFSDLFKLYWKNKFEDISPLFFKHIMETHLPIFKGHAQHDAQEFLSQLLDGIHEDVNKIIDKPYIDTIEGSDFDTDLEIARQCWLNFLKRNYSVIIQNFYGQFKSNIFCTECKNNSFTFDPFQLVSLPLPVITKSEFPLYFINKDHTEKIVNLNFEAESVDKFDDIKLEEVRAVFSEKLKVNCDRLVFCNLEYPDHNSVLDLKETVSKAFGLKQFKQTKHPELFLFELNETDMEMKKQTNAMPVFLRINYSLYDNEKDKEFDYEYTKLTQKYEKDSIFSQLLYLSPESKVNDLYFGVFRKLVHKTALLDQFGDYDDKAVSTLWNEYKTGKRDGLFFYIKIDDKRLDLEDSEMSLSYYIDKPSSKVEVDVFVYLPNENTVKVNLKDFMVCVSSNDISNTYIQSKSKETYKNSYTIQDLFYKFSKPELLEGDNSWFCNKCNKQTKSVKTIKVFKSPNYLIIHLKKLKHQGEKLPLITYPLENLDLSEFVINEHSIQSYHILPEEFLSYDKLKNLLDNSTQFIVNNKENDKGPVYDLYGVVNHFGGQHSGHYTSMVKVKKEWINFNDSTVQTISPSDVIGDAAYILFYKKRTE